jgi:branched-chain amino acid transport system substrate-binding protein
MKRRYVLGLVATSAGLPLARARAEDTIKIGAVVPLAGAFAASGQDMLHGAQLAAEEINAAGGIKSIGGRKIELLPGDAGQSPETAVTTARRILGEGPVASIGSWYSSLTLAATQVAEQKKIPWLTGSVADAIVGRGFKYAYQISAGSEASAQGLIDYIKLASPGELRLALLMDNNAANVDMKAYIRKKLPAPPVSDQTWAPPLPDATPAVTATLRADPTVIFIGATGTSDQALILKQLAAQGSTALVMMGASSAANPTFLEIVGAKAMESLLVVTGVAFPGKGSEDLVRKFAATTRLPFMDCEALTGYVNINIIAQALEAAGRAEPEAVKQALDSMDSSGNPALQLLPGGNHLRFARNGARIGTVVELVQWQDGRPMVVAPPEVANAELKRKSA